MFGGAELAETCTKVKQLGYDGLELAPFTLAPSAYDLSERDLAEIRGVVENHGLEVVGLHWLFTGQENMHTTSPDEKLWRNASDYLARLVEMCSHLGGDVLVIGSPKHRSFPPDQAPNDAWNRARDLYISVLDKAEDCGVDLCLEPLAPAETNFVNTVEEGLRMVREINHSNFKIHLDMKAMSYEDEAIKTIIRKVPIAKLGHVHVNDPNLYGPGMGELDYGRISEALKEIAWDRWLSVEVFKYDPDPYTIAQQSIEHLNRFWQR